MRKTMITMMLLLGTGATAAPRTPQSPAARTAATLDRIADSPPRLRIFLNAMPKGGDLHNHNGGSIYAEDFLRWAAAGGLCIATDTWRVVDPPCDKPGRIPAAGLEKDYASYSRAIDAFSTRGFESGVGDPMVSGYNRFFATFDAFGVASRGNNAASFALTRDQAAADHVAYVELGSGSHQVRKVVEALGTTDSLDFDQLYAKIAPAIPTAVAAARKDYDGYEADALSLATCATPEKPDCGVAMRYLPTAIRTVAPQQVFAQLAFNFALVEADPRFVGVNIAAPEHDPIAVRDYALHMRMIAWLKARHPTVKLSLHAGELTLGLVPPRDLAFHIREAVEVAGAKRIGHGIDISYEKDAPALLKRMARDRIDVEINLTSNAVILGVKGKAHPLSLYREYGVPVTLSTDDEGVSRSDMTNEYVRAVTEQGLRYLDLKAMVRDSLQYSFLPGASLWADRSGGARASACSAMESPACATFLAASPKAAKQAQLERDFATFEAAPH
ncbi:adenosine deaminase family protein [Sphingomonas immobilis]|uniref:adenosine deaminase n=1 Tax=Sphingomonas immobilis TaxID=3063997 RepID=A0ABT8ZT49_9SPHN|nr:adenosine deaminase [Sphingomonas sp. CA1-15]MDO7840730.1 adenosine deaminase [Sphingomonas sp. CA1-15]